MDKTPAVYRKYSAAPININPEINFIFVIHVPDLGKAAITPANVPTIISNVPIPRAKTKSRLIPSKRFVFTAT